MTMDGPAEGEFWMEELPDEAGRTRLGLVGELDISGADQFQSRLEAIAERGDAITLDLRRLQFIDSSGLGELIRAISDARRAGPSSPSCIRPWEIAFSRMRVVFSPRPSSAIWITIWPLS